MESWASAGRPDGCRRVSRSVVAHCWFCCQHALRLLFAGRRQGGRRGRRGRGEVGGGGGGSGGGRGGVAVGEALFTAAAAAVHEGLAQRAAQEQQQHRGGRATQEQQELSHQTQRGKNQSRELSGHVVGNVRQGDVTDALRQVARDVQDGECHHRGAQPLLPHLLLLLGGGGGGGGGGAAGFQVKDAREKLAQKDARFKIRGRGGGGAGGVQDARQMINSRKQGQNQFSVPAQTTQKTAVTHQLQSHALVPQIQIHTNNLAGVNTRHFAPNVQGLSGRASAMPQLSNNKRMMDARDRLSLKRSIGGTQTLAVATPPLKITKTIQRPVGMSGGIRPVTQPVSNEHDGISTKQMKITTANSMLQSRPGAVGSTFSMSAPITKVVKNDAYTAPRPPVPVAPTRPNTSMAAARSSAAALQPVSRTLQQSAAETSTTAPTPPQPAFSPLEGTKITVNNLHPRVTEEDIVELFCVCGALKRARLVKVGVAEVVFVRKEDAVSAYRKYNNRCLDGQPMKCNLHIQGNVITSDQPILLRLSDTPGIGGGTKKDGLPPSLSRPAGQRASSQPTPEVDPQTILKALFKSTAQSTSTTEPPSSQATAFRIKI
ncbi:polymerase delta-interacting protein 3 isoform X2 [Morone saxatilis]|uniref:polymerase delta-interacting protein 3 isoform X2 n=1 Tax=Morone saxatilis TaxID=34816 RepID=UPI0015E1FFED|nr:polymerase delta-interacting protein 3 isoform X2 [Morone saxatilis]